MDFTGGASLVVVIWLIRVCVCVRACVLHVRGKNAPPLSSSGGEGQTHWEDQRLRLRQLQGSQRLRSSHEGDERSVGTPFLLSAQLGFSRMWAGLVIIRLSVRLSREVCWQSTHQAEEEHVEGPKHRSGSQEAEGEEETRP